MKTSKKLFFLIKKLDASEKKHFTDLSKRAKENAGYLKLFKLIDASNNYDEEILKKKLGIKTNFHTYKNQLYHLILKSQRLILFDKKSVPNYTDNQLKGLMMDIQILEQKGLDKDARTLLRIARKKAEKEDKYQSLLILLKKELDFINRKDTQKIQEQTNSIFEEIQNCLKMIEIENQCWKFYYEIAFFTRKRGDLTEKQKTDLVYRIKTDHLLQEGIEINSFTISYLSYYIKAYQFYYTKDYSQYHHFLEKTIKVWEDYKHKKKEEPRTYKILLSNYINSCSIVRTYEKMPALLKKLEETETSSFAEEAETFINIAFYKLLYYLNTTDFTKSVINITKINNTIAPIEKGLKKYHNNMPKSRELAFYYNVSIFFFLIRDFYKASIWLDKILNEPKNEHRKDLVRVAHILQIIYHFELNNINITDALCDSVTQKFKRWNKVEEHEEIIIKHIKKLLYPISWKAKKQTFQTFHIALKAFREEHSKTAFRGLNEILFWLEHKIK